MENKKEIAEAEARKVLEWYERESRKVSEKYKNEPGLDTGAPEYKELTNQAHRKIQEIRKKYGI